MVEIRDDRNIWRYNLLEFKGPLRKGLSMVLNPAVVEMIDPARTRPAEDILCRVVGWKYMILSREIELLEITVEEVPERLRSPFKSPDTRLQFAAMLGALTFLVLGFFYYRFITLAVEQRWEMFYDWARPVIGLALFLFFSVLLPTRLGISRRSSFWSIYTTILFALGGLVIAGAWNSISARPDPSTGYTAYGQMLTDRLKADNWPLLLSILPWAAVAFKILGLETAEKTSDAFLKASGKKED